MLMKVYAAGLCAAVMAATAVYPAEAQTPTKKKQYVSSTSRAATASRPRARVVVEPRSFLDAGTEVRPGERKFTDYAYPVLFTPFGAVSNTGGRVGWHDSPLPGPLPPR